MPQHRFAEQLGRQARLQRAGCRAAGELTNPADCSTHGYRRPGSRRSVERAEGRQPHLKRGVVTKASGATPGDRRHHLTPTAGCARVFRPLSAVADVRARDQPDGRLPVLAARVGGQRHERLFRTAGVGSGAIRGSGSIRGRPPRSRVAGADPQRGTAAVLQQSGVRKIRFTKFRSPVTNPGQRAA